MNFLEILESTAFSGWVLTSMLGFPTLIALHSIGMAVAAGLTIVVALFLNRVFAGITEAKLPGVLRIATWGFMLNAVTGVSKFVGYLSLLLWAGVIVCGRMITFYAR